MRKPRPERRPDKFGDRRRELAKSALLTLAQRGYANTSLRDIANNSDFTHGVLHYYFADKNELMIFVVREYKAECVTRYDAALEAANSPADLCVRFAAAMRDTVVEDASMHRLWYDMRAQSYFDESFRPAVGEIEQGLEDMIWRVVTRFCELDQTSPALTSPQAYALIDGLFQQALFRWLGGDTTAGDCLTAQVIDAMEKLFT
jgi:TetR/AcrR family transcriptional regulator, transcriptional repressor of bet genes